MTFPTCTHAVLEGPFLGWGPGNLFLSLSLIDLSIILKIHENLYMQTFAADIFMAYFIFYSRIFFVILNLYDINHDEALFN